MNRKEYYDRLRRWEAEGYDVSELKEKWFHSAQPEYSEIARRQTMSTEGKITSAFDAEAVVRRALEAQHGDRIKELSITKSWYSSAGSKEFWDVEGSLKLKKGKVKQRSFRYQVDPASGEIVGFQETTMR